MQIGFAVPTSGSWARPDYIAELALLAEGLGYQSLWTFQRLLSPLDEEGHEVLDPQYRSVQDPLAVLGYLCGTTRRARLGVAVVNAPYYSPVLLSKMLTTLDHLSRGRLDVGIGLGWLPEEFEASGVDYRRRGARVDEFVSCLTALWTSEVVEHDDGAFYRIPRCRVEPKPVQTPHPPLLFGGAADAALRRAGRTGAGWISSSRTDLRTIGDSIAVVRGGAEDAGRDPADLRFVCRAVVKVRKEAAGPLVGPLEQMAGDLEALGEAGVTEAFIDLNFDPEIGSPGADSGRARERAMEVLHELAPRRDPD